MQGYNLIVVFHSDSDRMLMCRRKKEPYLGLSNFVGGKVELGENGVSAAYRELYEETSIASHDISLVHLMTFTYPLDPCYVEVYVGRLKEKVDVYGEENELYWSTMEHDFFDMKEYAGEGNIGHIVEHIKMFWDQLKL